MNENLKRTFKEAMGKIEEEVKTGLRHGHFELRVEGEIIASNKRRMIIRAN